MTDIAGAAREGLLAMSVAAGMAVMPAMFEAEIAEAAGRRASTTGPDRGAPRQRARLGDPRRAAGAGEPAAGAHPGWARGAAEPATPTSPPMTC